MYSGISYGLYCDFPSCRVSIDSVRLKFTYALNSFVWSRGFSILSIDKMSFIIDNLQIAGADFDVQWSYKDFFKIGAYCRTARVSGYLPGTCEAWSFAIMFGRYAYNASSHFLEPEIVMDFNPNKVPLYLCTNMLRVFSWAKRIRRRVILTKPTADSPARIDEELRFDSFLFWLFGSRVLTFIPRWSSYFDSHNCPPLAEKEWLYLPPDNVPKFLQKSRKRASRRHKSSEKCKGIILLRSLISRIPSLWGQVFKRKR